VFPDPGWGDADEAASRRLVSELEEVRGLVDEFDGELGIMSRLEAAISEIRMLRDEADRAVLYRALLFQGFAVARYFQDDLGSDPGAANYRTMAFGSAEVRPWVDAIALMPEEGLLEEYVPGPDEARAFDALRARVRAAPAATIECPNGAGQGCFVDGARVEGQAVVVPGLHYVALCEGAKLTLWTAAERVRLDPQQKHVQARGVVLADVAGALASMEAGAREVTVSDGVARELLKLDSPVHLGLVSQKGTRLYVLEGRKLRKTKAPVTSVASAARSTSGGAEVFANVGGGWMSNGDWLLLNTSVESSVGAVNASTLSGTVGVGTPLGALYAGVAMDAFLPLGESATLPVGSADVRGHIYPYGFVGLPAVQVSLGALLPWHLGVGARVNLPLTDALRVTVGYVHGVGLPRTREGVWPVFEPSNVETAWVSMGTSWGL